MSRGIIILLIFIEGTLISYGQAKPTKWSNKYNGTYIISFHYAGIGKDTSKCSITVKMYELSSGGCKKLTGKIAIKGKNYLVYDSTEFVDRYGEKDLNNYFGIDLSGGIYDLKASAGKDYYPIKTEQLILLPMSSYEFTFYFIRKDEVKRN